MSNNARFVVFGEALTDFIREDGPHWRAVAGGSCWNVARVGARLGIATGFAGAVSMDTFGDEIATLSAEAGLDLRYLQRHARAPFLAMVTSKHPPQYFFIGDDSADLHFNPERLPAGWLDDAQIVHFGSISLYRQPLAARLLDTAAAVKAAGKRICFDPNYRALMDSGYRPILQRMVTLADYIKISDEDIAHLFPGVSEGDALAMLRSWAPQASILFTRGAAGMSLLTPTATVERGVYAVEVKDTVGAGDASMGGWMASLLTRPGAALSAHLDFAAATAAAACRHNGAYAPGWAEVEALIAEAGTKNDG
ncbi:fructokinase [Andreprevotia lacus DSM 23236]|jgi:fructokinase|uniref:Fructokinase n=1 Tax=Andreprevotia lacus DSM 23236 TaxID=1121001 RepID=A0A1W1X3A0_9NEIS|nr:carbohydrate kinase [Andreprevotia lacus]SMC18412.1 fructokinase [Andreprevotia lacus DSM 23236]